MHEKVIYYVYDQEHAASFYAHDALAGHIFSYSNF